MNSKTKEIDRIIDLIGYTKYHIYLFTVTVLLEFAEGIVKIVLNFIVISLIDEWNLRKFQKEMIIIFYIYRYTFWIINYFEVY